jgi:hypothetical protein
MKTLLINDNNLYPEFNIVIWTTKIPEKHTNLILSNLNLTAQLANKKFSHISIRIQ